MFFYLLMICVFSAFVFRDNYPTIDQERQIDINQDTSIDVGNWRSRIERTANEFHLSPRQTEVFFMLAKGRNAEHMQKEFFISKATAKAHIYSIYRKTGVHSQQELIDLIESKSDAKGRKRGASKISS
jgi:DNA-binding CsgD family transcriptional regulator